MGCEPPAITLARKAYNAAGDLLDHRTAELATARQAFTDAEANLARANDFWDTAASNVDKLFGVLRDLVAEWHAAGDPPEYDPDGAAAQRIAEEFADGSAELARIEAEEARGV